MKSDPIKHTQEQLLKLEKKMLAETAKRQLMLSSIHSKQYHAANNLVHYLAFRNDDIRDLQYTLHTLGLSSLASAESHIHRQLQSVLQRLGTEYLTQDLDICTYEFGMAEIEQKSKTLFGQYAGSAPYIMVTFDSSFASDYDLIKALLQSGMNVARINCAHDDETTWLDMIKLIEKARGETGLDCKIYMDMAGPKIRTMLLGKGHKKGKTKIEENGLIWLADDAKGFDVGDIVISPNVPGIIPMLKAGERVYIDDGMIKGVIETAGKEQVAVRLTRISSRKPQVKSGKGINFPDSEISISPLTDFDKTCLPFICKHADMVGYSFVHNASDLATLQELLTGLSLKPPYIVLKIETPEAVTDLPALLLQGMKQEAFGVMIARGDLAVEIGFERMGEIQEEILWICEAAHVPVIWATQVLETLNKSGMATRSEITDAMHAAQAECIMINKGDHAVKVITTLRDILHRTGGHRIKKRFIFRPLGIAQKFING